MDVEDEIDLTEEGWTLEREGPPMDFLTASSLGNREMVRYHLSRGQDVNEQSEGGWTALMYACASHRDDLVWSFLNSGADISVVDQQGRHFLTVAAENGNVKALRLLRTQMGSVWEFICNKNYKFALKNWMNVIQEDITEPDRWETVKSIINLPERKNGFTPLMLAAQQSDNEMVTLLLSMGADNIMRDHSGRTPSELAVLNGHQATCWLLKFYDNFTVRDVLEDSGLLKYYELFTQVTVDDLLRFDEGKLKILGLKLLGPRKKLLMTIDKIKASKLKRHEVLSLERDKTRIPQSCWNERLEPSCKIEKCTFGPTALTHRQNLFSLST